MKYCLSLLLLLMIACRKDDDGKLHEGRRTEKTVARLNGSWKLYANYLAWPELSSPWTVTEEKVSVSFKADSSYSNSKDSSRNRFRLIPALNVSSQQDTILKVYTLGSTDTLSFYIEVNTGSINLWLEDLPLQGKKYLRQQ